MVSRYGMEVSFEDERDELCAGLLRSETAVIALKYLNS
jgi:hypothetical protein